MKKHSKEVRREIGRKRKPRDELVQAKDSDLLSSGYTPLDVACSGKVRGGFAKGLFIMIVGDSSSGKTFLSQTCLAEAANNPEFDDYDFYFDDIERGNLMNTRRFFGSKMADRLMPPNGTKGEPVYSETVEDLYFTLDDKLNSGRPFIYVVDSMDGLIAKDDKKKFQKHKAAHRKGQEEPGSYGMSKAKANVNLRMMMRRMEQSGSIVIIIFQTRDNVNAFGWGAPAKTRSGGTAPKFFAHLELWTSIVKKITKEVKGKKRHIGTVVQIDIQKNRLTGWEGKVQMPFLKTVGIDNVGGCIDYLVDEGHWKKSGKGVAAKEFGVTKDREALVHYVEENGLERKLGLLVKTVFNEIMSECTPERKRRYQ